MEKDNSKNGLSRRGFIGIGSAALATVVGSLAVGSAMAQQGQMTDKPRADGSVTDPGPTNEGLDSQNRDAGLRRRMVTGGDRSGAASQSPWRV
jgi:hypothetical protein